ncbi:hypothetical protein HMPREF0731_3079 [Pseudoroseomonas cervicalis ATCC 49957]|nr:hypothetical protein HMPREF0731_3079 [Pseudoroseomonas cervicalis ATCC 49957]
MAGFTDPFGSSPRLRGTQVTPVVAVEGDRFIPAPAGNTGAAPSGRRTSPGSSPRLRGTLNPAAAFALRQRFIPAPAGNTAHGWRAPSPPPVHPRACGEHSAEGSRNDGDDGSSPRLRGTRAQGSDPGERGRFIPAPAGNTIG